MVLTPDAEITAYPFPITGLYDLESCKSFYFVELIIKITAVVLMLELYGFLMNPGISHLGDTFLN